MNTRVAIFGGGVAGLSAAHELVRRGFNVAVYEQRGVLGGKARSMRFKGSGKDGRLDLPGEHGFRIFPAFYQHLDDTMRRIPVTSETAGRRTAYDHLVAAEQFALAKFDRPILSLPTIFPDELGGIRRLGTRILSGLTDNIGMSHDDLLWFAGRLLRVVTSCVARRDDELEKISWWNFVGADGDSRSPGYKAFVGASLCCGLAAVRPISANARVQADIIVQLLLALVHPGVSAVRCLNGPTSDAWIDPWEKYLRDQQVDFHLGCKVLSLTYQDGTIGSATIEDSNGLQSRVDADYFVLALPVEVAARFFGDRRNAALVQADPTFGNILRLGTAVDWMSGLQFYLNKKTSITNGHILYVDSPWSLTSVSQAQFWPDVNLEKYGNGEVQDIISVCLSNWNANGILLDKTAKECSRDEIGMEVWAQLQCSLNVDGQEVLRDEDLVEWFLDPDIADVEEDGRTHAKYTNAEPLMVANVDTGYQRPNAFTAIPNLLLASDYIRTNTQLPCMETANEAARRAVNAIIDHSDAPVPHCEIWPLAEPLIFKLWQWLDGHRFSVGLPLQQIPGLFFGLQWLLLDTNRVRRMTWRAVSHPRSFRRRP